MSTRLYDRDIRLTIADLEMNAARIEFEITKSLKPEPNTCEIRVYNLNPSHRAHLATPAKLPVRLSAGYKGALTQLYLGEVRRAQHTTQGADILTTVSTADSEDVLKKIRINQPIGNAKPAEVLGMLVRALGVSEGNASQMVAKLRARGSADVYGKSAVLSGHVRDELTDFCKSSGIEWSVQDGRLQFLDLNQPLEGAAVEISPSTGLVGSPSVDNKGLAQAKCLMIPLLVPGRKVSFNSMHLKGGYRVIHCKYSGDTHGQDWTTEIVCKKY